MGFFDKAKRMMNVGGAKVEIMPPGVLPRGGVFALQAKVVGGKLDQKITGVVAKLQQKTQSTNRGVNNTANTTSTKTLVISQADEAGFDLKAGETKDLSFQLQATVGEDPTLQGGMMGTLAKMNKMATQAKEAWEVIVTAEIEGSADASANQEVKIG